MSTIAQFFSSYWWVFALLLTAVLYKPILRLFFGMVIIPEDKIGLVTKKFVLFGSKRNLPDGRIIALEGEAGYQGKTLAPGLYWGYWPWQYEINREQFIVIPEGSIGQIDAKDGAQLPTGHILARSVPCDNFQDAVEFFKNGGQKGRQTGFITAGSYRINTHLFNVHVVKSLSIGENMVGIVTALDGAPLPQNSIAGKEITGHNNFQDFDTFLQNGGSRGLQPQVILAGSYNLNPWAVTVEETPMTDIKIGHVGVVISYIGEEGQDLTGEKFKHGNLVAKGYKGVWAETLGPGKYAINKYTTKVEEVPTTNLVLNWATGRNESHSLDKHLSTITVRSKDGFQFNLDVSQIIHIPTDKAPMVIARFGSMNNLVSQVLEPTIGNYFRNSAQSSDVLAFLSERSTRQKEAKQHIDEVLTEYNVQGVDTLIGDIVPPESIMKTLSERKIADEQQITFEAQKKAQTTREAFEKAKSIADMQPEIVKANQNVEIAEKTADAAVKKATGEARSVELAAAAEAKAVTLRAGAESERVKMIAGAEAEKIKALANADAEKITVTGNAQASTTLAIGKAEAEAYKLQVAAMGQENFTQLKVLEQIGKEGIKLIPDVLIGGGSGQSGGIDGLMGLTMLQMLGGNKGVFSNLNVDNFKTPTPAITEGGKTQGNGNPSTNQGNPKK